MVQIFGGGYTEGDKISVGNPAGWIARSQENGSEGVIYVAMNYRIGLFVRTLSTATLHGTNIPRDG
jgi:carboxylesterase type B